MENRKNKLISLNEFYQYVFGNKAVINIPEKAKISDEIKISRREKREKQIKETFSFVLNGELSSTFHQVLLELKSSELARILFDNKNINVNNNNATAIDANKNMDQYKFPTDAEIKDKFQNINATYQSFNENDPAIVENFIIFFKGCKLIADYIECNNDKDNEKSYLHAYKMLVLFATTNTNNPFQAMENYLKIHNFLTIKEDNDVDQGDINNNNNNNNDAGYSSDSEYDSDSNSDSDSDSEDDNEEATDTAHPVSSALELDLPKTLSNIDLLKWRTLIQNKGPRAASLFKLAPEIESYLQTQRLLLIVLLMPPRMCNINVSMNIPGLANYAQNIILKK